MYKFLTLLTLFIFLSLEAKVYPSQLISKGDTEALKKAFDEKQIDINTTCGTNTPMIVCAVQDDQIKIMDLLLSKGANINYKDEKGQSLLHLAAFDDNLTTIKYLESKGLDLNLKDSSGETLIHNAVFSANIETIKYIFSKGIADINTTDSYGKSLFYTACKNAHLEVIKYFISQGVDVNKKLGSFSPVFIALESYNNIENVFATLKYLVSVGANISDPALLEVATRTGKLESLKYLLQKQNLQNDLKTIQKLLKISARYNRMIKIMQYLMTKVTLSKDELDALLAISIENRKLKIAKYLISKGADVNAKVKYNNPIIFSSLFYEKVFKFLIKNGVDHTVFNSHGETILHDVVSLSSIDTFLSKGDSNKKFRMLLLKEYFSIDILDDNANTLLHSACKTNNIAMIDYFLDHNLSMSKTNKDGETPLHYAMKYSDEKTLIHIIEKYPDLFETVMLHKVVKGEDKNFARWAEYSPVFFTLVSPLVSQEKKEKLFHLTIVKKNYLASKILVANGVDVNLQDKDKNTILHHLAYSKDVALLRWFLENGANRYSVNLSNETPLHISVSENNFKFIHSLIENNRAVSKKYTNGRTILHEAIKTQNIELLKLVIPYVKDMNMQDNDGNTALHLAAKIASLEILKYLVLEKSDLNIKNNFNITPLMLITKREDLNKKELSTFMNISADAVQTVIKPYVFFNHDVDTVTVMSDKSKFILSSRYRDSIYIWDVKSFREIKKLKLKENPREIKSIPNSTLLALKSKGKIAIYDIESEDYVVTFNIDKLRDFKVSTLGDKIYALGEKDKLFHIDIQHKSIVEDKNTVSYIPSSSKLAMGKDEQLVALRYKGIEVYNFKEETTTKYALKNDRNYKITKMYSNEDNDILLLDQHTKYEVKPKNMKRDIYVKKDNTYVKLKTIQSAETLSTNMAFDKKNTILYVLDQNKSKLHTYSKKNHFKVESTDIPTELMGSNITLLSDQIIFAKNPQYGSLKVSLFDLKSQKIISSKETSSEDIGYHLFVKHFNYKRSKLNNQKLYQEYYSNYNAYDKPMRSYTLITNKDGSKLIKKKGHRIIKEGADGKVIYTLDTEHKYYLQYQIDEKCNLMATWSETTELGSVYSDNFITLIDTVKGTIKKKISVENIADFGFIGKYLYIQSYRKVVFDKSKISILTHGAISLYNSNTGEYIKTVDLANVDLKIDDFSEKFPYISFSEKINDQTFWNILDLETENIIVKLEAEEFASSSFSQDNIFVYSNPFEKMVLFDLSTKKEVYIFEDMQDKVYQSFFVSKDIIGFLVDTGKFVLYDFNTKKKLVDIFTFKDSWIMITPESYFTGGGTFADKLTFLDGYQNIYDTHQLYDHFFRPDIVKLKLHGEDIHKFIKDNTLHNALKNPPPKLYFKSIENNSVKLSGFTYTAVETKKEKVNLSFNVKEHDGGGIGLIRVYQEGKLIQTIGEGKVNKQSANIDTIIEQEKLDSTVKENQKTYIASLSKSIQGEISIEDTIAKVEAKTTTNQSGNYELEIELKSGKNEISIEAFNKTNTVTSYRENITINANIPKQKPKLYAIVAGVNEFEAPSVNNLKYSENDAQAIKEAAEEKMKTVFDEVEVLYLTAKEVTKENIFQAAQEISKKAKLDDTVLFYISTHGRAARGKLYLVPYNNKSVKNWIDFEQTFQAVQSIKALNQIFIIDACESGKANDIVSSVYDSRASVLAKSSGVHMLLATTKGTFAFEHPDKNIKNGVFTYRILQALKDHTIDTNKDSLISILELSKKLKEPANNADYQYPVIRNVGKDVDLEMVVR